MVVVVVVAVAVVAAAVVVAAAAAVAEWRCVRTPRREAPRAVRVWLGGRRCGPWTARGWMAYLRRDTQGVPPPCDWAASIFILWYLCQQDAHRNTRAPQHTKGEGNK